LKKVGEDKAEGELGGSSQMEKYVRIRKMKNEG
jgi:hypothetical protein